MSQCNWWAVGPESRLGAGLCELHTRSCSWTGSSYRQTLYFLEPRSGMVACGASRMLRWHFPALGSLAGRSLQHKCILGGMHPSDVHKPRYCRRKGIMYYDKGWSRTSFVCLKKKCSNLLSFFRHPSIAWEGSLIYPSQDPKARVSQPQCCWHLSQMILYGRAVLCTAFWPLPTRCPATPPPPH